MGSVMLPSVTGWSPLLFRYVSFRAALPFGCRHGQPDLNRPPVLSFSPLCAKSVLRGVSGRYNWVAEIRFRCR